MKNIFFTLFILAIFYHIALSQNSIKRENFNYKNKIIYTDQGVDKSDERKLMFNGSDGKNITTITLSKADRVELSPNKKSVYIYRLNMHDYTKCAVEIYNTKGTIKNKFNIKSIVSGFCVNDNGIIVIYGEHDYEGHQSYYITVYNKDGETLVKTRELTGDALVKSACSIGLIWKNKLFYIIYIRMGQYYLNCYKLANAELEWTKELTISDSSFSGDFTNENSFIADYRNNRLVLIGKDEQGNKKEIYINFW